MEAVNFSFTKTVNISSWKTSMVKGTQNDDEPDTFIDVETVKQEVQDNSDDDFICIQDEEQYSVYSRGHLRSSLEFVEVKCELPRGAGSEERENDGVWSEGNFGAPVKNLEVKQELPGDGCSEEMRNGCNCPTTRRPQRAASKNVLKVIGEILRAEEEPGEPEENTHFAARGPHESHVKNTEVSTNSHTLHKYKSYREKNNEASRRSRQRRRRRIAEAEAEVAHLEELLPRLRVRAQKLEALVARFRRAVNGVVPYSVAEASAGPSQ